MSSDNSFTPPPAVEQLQAPRPKSSGINIPTFIISLVLVAAIAGGAGWFVGNSGGYANAQADFRNNPQAFIQAVGGFGGFGAGGAGQNGSGRNGGATGGTGTGVAGRGAGGFRGTTQGKITAVNGDTLTVETADKSITVNTSSTTRVAGVTTMTLGDLKVGNRVTVLGPTSGDSITATTVVSGSLNGLLGGFGGLGGPAGANSGTPVPNP